MFQNFDDVYICSKATFVVTNYYFILGMSGMSWAYWAVCFGDFSFINEGLKHH